MTAYSLDLRQKIMDAIERGVGTRSEIASLFGVHESFVYKLLRQQRELGDIAPLPHGGGAAARLDEERMAMLSDWVAHSPDATLDELRLQLKQQMRIEVSVPTVWRALNALGLSRKKSPSARPRPTRRKEPNSRRSKKSFR